jgi:coenzyme F420 hydrogenase subunit beta
MTQPGDVAAGGLMETVVAGDYCVGCGACAMVSDGALEMRLDPQGRYRPVPVKPLAVLSEEIAAACPFSGASVSEDEIAAGAFPDSPHWFDGVGRWLRIAAGHVVEDDYRARGSSGGLGSWLPAELLRRGMVDEVLHVKAVSDDHPLFDYAWSTTSNEAKAGARSRYYPVEMSRALARVRQKPGRYALVGLPCFIKAARQLSRRDPVLRERLVFHIGLVCGHLKSTRYADYFAWQLSIPPGRLAAIDFRAKVKARHAKNYYVEVRDRTWPEDASRDSHGHNLDGGDWGLGYFKLKACDFCDDVIAETADIAIGDAWLPRYVADHAGTCLLVVRHPTIAEVLNAAHVEGRLVLDYLSPEDAARSQDAGLRHRRGGLAYRLWLADREGRWRPPKRVKASRAHLTPRERTIFLIREALRDATHATFGRALRWNDPGYFRRAMWPLVRLSKLARRRFPKGRITGLAAERFAALAVRALMVTRTRSF